MTEPRWGKHPRVETFRVYVGKEEPLWVLEGREGEIGEQGNTPQRVGVGGGGAATSEPP